MEKEKKCRFGHECTSRCQDDIDCPCLTEHCCDFSEDVCDGTCDDCNFKDKYLLEKEETEQYAKSIARDIN